MTIGVKKKILMLKKMILIRRTEETILREYRKGTVIGAIHLSIGQEAVPVGVCEALQEDDYLFSTHRGHGHALAKGCDLKRMMAELMGKETGLCRGHGGSMHLYQKEIGLMGGNGIVGGGIPLSLGPAFAAQYREQDRVSVAFFSDGASNQGTFHESLNLASLWKLPVIFVCENNCYAATTPVQNSCAVIDIAGHAKGYGIPGVAVEGNSVIAVYSAAQEAVARARSGEGPTLLECKTYRIEPHCGIIQDQRKPGEREAWQKKDPIISFRSELISDKIITDVEIRKIEESVDTELKTAVDYANQSPYPDPNDPQHMSWQR
jgi:TPP-dependent pyruvate/acetoin dehydrogenase alpha subunit